MSSDEFVCGACFDDQGLKDFCLNHAESMESDFCGATDSEPIAAPLDEVIAHINSCIHRYFDDPTNAGLPTKDAVGFVYYSGAGISRPRDHMNYIIPLDIHDLTSENIWSNAISLDQLLRE